MDADPIGKVESGPARPSCFNHIPKSSAVTPAVSHRCTVYLDRGQDDNRKERRNIEYHRTKNITALYLQRRAMQYRVGLSGEGAVACVQHQAGRQPERCPRLLPRADDYPLSRFDAGSGPQRKHHDLAGAAVQQRQDLVKPVGAVD